MREQTQMVGSLPLPPDCHRSLPNGGNGDRFIDQVRTEIGLDLEIIDRQTEAGLAAAGASPLICGNARSVIVFDIGGGSTEILWLNIRKGRYEIMDWTSIPAGVVTIAEQFGGKTVSAESFAAMRAHVGELAAPFSDRLRNVKSMAPYPTICWAHRAPSQRSAAFTRTCAAMTGRGSTAWMLGAEMHAVTSDLFSMTYEQRPHHLVLARSGPTSFWPAVPYSRKSANHGPQSDASGRPGLA